MHCLASGQLKGHISKSFDPICTCSALKLKVKIFNQIF
jgi:hypothetical protein